MTDPSLPIEPLGTGALVVTPTYNERDGLAEYVQTLHRHAPGAHLLIVDDASPDGTGALADDLAAKDDRIHVLHRAGKLGLGSAYVEGFTWGLARDYRVFALRSTCMTLVLELAELVDKKHRLAEPEDLSAIIARIRERPEQRINLDALAKEAALSPTRFINAFKQATGFPPLHYQLFCRLNEAKRRLGDTTESITAIASSLGFASSQHFSTHFKKMFGCTPKASRTAPTREPSQ